jgi:putative addiction module component (TIGR02574 family)
MWYDTSMNASILPQVQSLSVRERLELVDEIWQTVMPEFEELEVNQEEKELLDSRWAKFLQNPATALSVEQFKKELNALRA